MAFASTIKGIAPNITKLICQQYLRESPRTSSARLQLLEVGSCCSMVWNFFGGMMMKNIRRFSPMYIWGIVVENKPIGLYIGDEILPSYITYIGIIS